MKYYAVIDTNIIVSSMLKHNSIPGEIIDLVFSQTIIPLLNDEILEEYRDVLTRNKFGFSDLVIEQTLEVLKMNGIFIAREQTIEDFIDEDDAVFYEIVMSARQTMDAYLITGNIKHFPIKPFVVTPKEMLEIINNNVWIRTSSKAGFLFHLILILSLYSIVKAHIFC